MSANDRIILNEVLARRHADVDPDSKASEFFELFTAEQILKDFELSYDEIESGIVGDGGDGGVDSVYLFVNGELVQEESDFSLLKKNIVMDLVLIQAKMSTGFQETPVERFVSAADDIFDLSKPIATLTGVYNPLLIEKIDRFRSVHQQLAAKFPTIRVRFFYASKGDSPNAKVSRKVDKLEDVVRKYFPTVDFEFNFLGASQLLTLARRAPQTSFSLALAENPISAAGDIAFICLVKLTDYFEFITECGQLRRAMFEANVRDYQGRTEVNDEIQRALLEKTGEDFWWLNNGITVLATKASQSGKTLTLEDPQIVNGLQTSSELFAYRSGHLDEPDNRNILVRVIVPLHPASRDRIIKATNSQTAVQLASLRATDKIHRDIEEYLRPRGLFYDRRKNLYKNEGRPRDRIVGIPHLAQSVMAIVLQRPDSARARPSSLLKKDEDYARVFNTKYPIQMYYVCAEVMRKTEDRLRSTDHLDRKDRNNLRFYVAMHVVCSLLKVASVQPQDLVNIDPASVSGDQIDQSLKVVEKIYRDLGGSDQVAKGSALLGDIKANLSLG